MPASPSASPRYRRSMSLGSRLIAISIALALMPADDAEAKKRKRVAKTLPVPAAPAPQPAASGPALMTLVSIDRQRAYVYGADGLITQTRVSTGVPGRDTPRGIFTVLQKKEEHASNLYDSASMPFMQRLLWSGIAMHAGEVPGYPASHGCVRLPYGFAEKYFAMTSLNHRVVITPDVHAPVKFDHALLPMALPAGEAATTAATSNDAATPGAITAGAMIAGAPNATPAQRTQASAAAGRAAEKQRLVAEDTTAKEMLAAASTEVAAAEAELDAARKMLAPAVSEQRAATDAAARARRAAAAVESDIAARLKRLAKAKRLSDGIRAERQAEIAAQRARLAQLTAVAAEAGASVLAAQSALGAVKERIAGAQSALGTARTVLETYTQHAANATKAFETFMTVERNRPRPVSIFISAQTGRAAMRQWFHPAGDGPIEIADPYAPLGTFVFTATGWKDETRTSLDWIVVKVDERERNWSRKQKRNSGMPKPTSAEEARATLERLHIPEETRLMMGEVLKPGSSIIISDYDVAHSETGVQTDFIVGMPEVIAPDHTDMLAGRETSQEREEPRVVRAPAKYRYTYRLNEQRRRPPPAKWGPAWGLFGGF